MKFLQVNYSRATPRSDVEQAVRLTAAAEAIAEVPGLLWKMWVYDDESKIAGGMYLFDSEANARAWGDGPMEPSLSSLPGIDSIEKLYFDVDPELSRITRAPLSSEQAADHGE